MTSEYFFVYGTLKRDYGNNRLLTTSEFIGEAETTDACWAMEGRGFPMVYRTGVSRVAGEVWRVTSPQVVEALDRLEGHPNWYKRELVSVNMYEGEDTITVEAWMYIMPEGNSTTPYSCEGEVLSWGVTR